MKATKLAEMSEDELRREADSLAEEIFRLRFRLGTGNIENPSKIRVTRRTLARVKTILRERELKLRVSHRPPGSASDSKDEGAK